MLVPPDIFSAFKIYLNGAILTKQSISSNVVVLDALGAGGVQGDQFKTPLEVFLSWTERARPWGALDAHHT